MSEMCSNGLPLYSDTTVLIKEVINAFNALLNSQKRGSAVPYMGLCGNVSICMGMQ